MTTWNDYTRVRKIEKILKDIRHDLGIIDRLLSHLDAGKVPTGPLPLEKVPDDVREG